MVLSQVEGLATCKGQDGRHSLSLRNSEKIFMVTDNKYVQVKFYAAYILFLNKGHTEITHQRLIMGCMIYLRPATVWGPSPPKHTVVLGCFPSETHSREQICAAFTSNA